MRYNGEGSAREEAAHFGSEHPDTILAMDNLAITLRKQGQLEESTMVKEVLEKRGGILSEEHLTTISTMAELTSILEEQGQLEDAIALSQVTIQ